MVGVIDNLGEVPCAHFRRGGDRLVLLGRDRGEFGGSAYLGLLHGIERGRPPRVDLDEEARLAKLLRAAIAAGLLRTAHDLSEGGLAVALAEATFGERVGVSLRVDLAATALFSESQGRALVAVTPRHLDRFLGLAAALGVPASDCGETGGDELRIAFDGGELRAPVAALHESWSTALPRALGL
jgi:phosphoribosylformylglycinamidine synthase